MTGSSKIDIPAMVDNAVSLEEFRMAKVLSMLPSDVSNVLEIGARHGVMTRKLIQRVQSVTALDLRKPPFEIERVVTVEGNVESLQFDSGAFDCVVCTEVLEHVPKVAAAARELARVSRKYLLVGVPFRQDTRISRTTCPNCGKANPPYGHLNSFDEERLSSLFPNLRNTTVEYCAETRERTNALSVWLQDLARNPYGAYEQEEPCVFCGSKLEPPRNLSFLQRAAGAAGFRLYKFQEKFNKPLPTWILLLMQKAEVADLTEARGGLTTLTAS